MSNTYITSGAINIISINDIENNIVYNNDNNDNLVLDFLPYGKVIGKDITWEDVIKEEEERIKNLTEPPILSWFAANIHITTKLPLENVQNIIESAIHNIDINYAMYALKEKEKREEDGIFSPPPKYHNPIDNIQLTKRNMFDWLIEITHTSTTNEILSHINTAINDNSNNNNINKRDSSLYVKMEVRIYRMPDVHDKHFIGINRLSGRSQTFYDFSNTLSDALHNTFN